MKQYLYVMTSGSDHVKVGISADPEKRRAVIQHANGSPVALLTSFGPYNSASAIERAVHELLSEHRLIGEWFGCGTEVALKAIGEAQAAHVDGPEKRGIDDEFGAATALIEGAVGAPAQRLIELAEALMARLTKQQQAYEALLAEFEGACQLVDEYAQMTRDAQHLARRAIEGAQPSLLN